MCSLIENKNRDSNVFQPKLKSKAWSDLQSFTKQKYPPCVKYLLIATGYNKLVTLAELDEEKLRKVEEHVNNNRSLLSTMKCCYSEFYRKQQTFGFLPGHKAVILSISQHVQQMKSQNVPKRSKPKSLQSEDKLKSMLIDGVYKSLERKGAVFPKGAFSERNIAEFNTVVENDKNVHKCKFSCPFCAKNWCVRYKAWWENCNLVKHLNKHYESFKEKNGLPLSFEDVVVEVQNGDIGVAASNMP